MRQTPVLKVIRIEALADGLFATAMTVLVFSVNLPATVNNDSLANVLTADVLSIIFIYAGSFIILGTQWVKINILQGFLDHVNRPYFWMNILYLIPAGIVPFSTSILIEYPHNPISILFYVSNLMISSIIQILVWRCGVHYKLYNNAYNKHVDKVLMYRMLMPFIFYVSSLLVAYVHTTLAFSILVIQPLFHLIPSKIDQYINKHHTT
jgi:uncharacterized membrane protein